MSQERTLELISGIMNRMLVDKGEAAQAISADTVILGGDLDFDSLDLAALVVELDTVTRLSPFASGFVNFRTVGELAALYSGPHD